jgi:hypothetical protein
MERGTSKWLTRLRNDEKQLVARKEHPQLFWGTFSPSATLIISSASKLMVR